MTDADVIVAGGGAAGLFAAAVAAERGLRVILLEKNRRPGVKILASGGSRCNVAPALPTHQVVQVFPRAQGRFLGDALRRLGPDDVIALLARAGVKTQVEKYAKWFPESGRATDVLAALLARAERAGVRTHVERPLLSATRESDGAFRCDTPAGPLRSRRLVLAVGGASYPKSGTTGDGYTIAAAFGHTIVPPRPALVPLAVASGDSAWVTALSGVTIDPVTARMLDDSGRVLAERRDRPLLFTHTGLSGFAAMDVSRAVDADHPHPALEIDFLPELDARAVQQRIAEGIAAHPTRTLANAVDLPLPQRLLEALFASADVPPSKRAAEVSPKKLERLAAAVHACRVRVDGTLGFAKAEVTAGGVALAEVDPITMESLRTPGLHLCGEVLDVDGPIGGFNFQAAFATGAAAGEAAASAIQRSSNTS